MPAQGGKASDAGGKKKEHRIGGESRESFMTGKEKKDLSH